MKDKMYLVPEDTLVNLIKNARRWEAISDAAVSDELSDYFMLDIDHFLNEFLEKTPFRTFTAMAFADIACHYEEAT